MSNAVAFTPQCELCDGTGWKRAPDGNVTRLMRCDCWKAARQTHADGVPVEFHSATLDNYSELPGNQKAVQVMRAWLEDSRDLYLCGGVGAGKTRLACSLVNEAYRRTGKGWFVRVPMLLLKLQPQKTDEAAEESAGLLRRLSVEPIVVLDDVGAERESASDYTRRTLLTVYEERGDRGLRTIWTSNLRLSPKAGEEERFGRAPTLAEFLKDDRLPSRIAGRAQVVWIGTPDQRIRRGK